jgi:hydroxymethylpyrimidine/phosphomethylpyrimidine kinase
MVLAQVRAVLADIGVDAVKVGMLATSAVAGAVAIALDELPAGVPVVVDPVMVAESGARLLDAEAEGAVVEQILPRATVLTPNVPEARVLAAAAIGPDAAAQAEPEELLRAVLALGPRAAVLTGGHRERAVDLFATAGEPEAPVAIEGERHPDGAAHGSGCTHSAALAAQLALGRDPLAAARAARELAGEAIAGGLRDVGAGTGPVDVLGLPRMRAR